MNYFVFIDDNNGHRCDYYNFKSNATLDQIHHVTEQMRKECPAYGRMGSKVHNLAEKLMSLGFKFELENNPRNRQAVDRVSVWCISGNY